MAVGSVSFLRTCSKSFPAAGSAPAGDVDSVLMGSCFQWCCGVLMQRKTSPHWVTEGRLLSGQRSPPAPRPPPIPLPVGPICCPLRHQSFIIESLFMLQHTSVHGFMNMCLTWSPSSSSLSPRRSRLLGQNELKLGSNCSPLFYFLNSFFKSKACQIVKIVCAFISLSLAPRSECRAVTFQFRASGQDSHSLLKILKVA